MSGSGAPHSSNVLVAIPEIPDALRSYLHAQLAGYPQLQLHFAASSNPAELLPLTADAEVIVGWRVPQEVLDTASKLRLWVFPGAGVQNLIDPLRKLATQHPITLVNSHANAYAVAQHAVALLLALANRVVLHHNWMAAGRWRTGDAEAASVILRGKRVGLLGYGAINRQVHRLLSGFDLSFAALKRSREVAIPQQPGAVNCMAIYGVDQLQEFLHAADVLIVAVPLTGATRALIGAPELQQLGIDGCVVNVARGEVISEQPLYSALRDGGIAGAALDVWYEYRPQPDAKGRCYPYHLPFHELSQVVLSPHRAASPVYALERWADVVENLQRYATGKPLLNIVDLDRGY